MSSEEKTGQNASSASADPHGDHDDARSVPPVPPIAHVARDTFSDVGRATASKKEAVEDGG